MLRPILFLERLSLRKKRWKLSKKDEVLRSALGVFDSNTSGERSIITGIMQKRCLLAEEMTTISVWLSQGARPVIIAPADSGKGIAA